MPYSTAPDNILDLPSPAWETSFSLGSKGEKQKGFTQKDLQNRVSYFYVFQEPFDEITLQGFETLQFFQQIFAKEEGVVFKGIFLSSKPEDEQITFLQSLQQQLEFGLEIGYYTNLQTHQSSVQKVFKIPQTKWVLIFDTSGKTKYTAFRIFPEMGQYFLKTLIDL